jgi:hypothetical protein
MEQSVMKSDLVINNQKKYGVRFFATLALLTLWSPMLFAQSRGIDVRSVETAAQTPFVGGVYRALIIGNSDYRDPKGRWPSLKTAVTDAQAVAKLLREDYGFSDIDLRINATRRDILVSLRELAKRVTPNDSVLIYYAGHGFLDQETNNGFWVPVDARGVDFTTFVRNSTIRDEIGILATRVKHTLLVSDSCFSGSLLRTASRGISAAADTQSYYQKVARKKSVQVVTAGGLEFVDDDYRESGHSPFTYFWLNELKHNDRPLITASELSTHVQKAVANNVAQVPESGVVQGAGDELGEFIFIKINVSVEGIPRENVKVDVTVSPAKKDKNIPAPVQPPKKDSDTLNLFPLPTL